MSFGTNKSPAASENISKQQILGSFLTSEAASS